MNSALWIAKTGLDAQQTRLSVIANNLANANTTAYKRSRAVFEDLLYQNVRQVGSQSTENTKLPSGLMLGTGVRTVATEKNHSQGNMIQTENNLDVAIQGRGYFQILQPDGSLAYTRDGSFQVNDVGELVTAGGYQVQPAITIPNSAQSIAIGSDGVVSVTVQGSAAPTQIGSIQLADFQNPTGLQPMGENLYNETAASGSPQNGTPGLNGLGSVVQGALESSNVNSVKEMVELIETQRAYEMNSKAISTADQMLQYLNNNL
ncbi:MAG: flagellar basal-body rod protein FlgG [Gammaproteobacteria bacterium]|nr:flagellar basal-body rod protein FlgG [Gammaproteobacteria bacterium]MCF6363805.1 flagellar basal-body rod protein FlgG [Gammaproteobacteria bacterium]